MSEVVITVAHKNSDFHDVLHFPTGSFDYCLEVAQHLFILSNKIAWRHNIAFSIAASLPGQEEELPSRYENAVTEATRACQDRWVNDSFSHVCPTLLLFCSSYHFLHPAEVIPEPLHIISVAWL